MVMIQVVDVNQTFDHLIQLKQNQWKLSTKTEESSSDQLDSNYKTVNFSQKK